MLELGGGRRRGRTKGGREGSGVDGCGGCGKTKGLECDGRAGRSGIIKRRKGRKEL